MDDEAKLTLHGLVQHYIMLNEEEKNRKLNDLLDALDFNQVCGVQRCPVCTLAPFFSPCTYKICAQHVRATCCSTCVPHAAAGAQCMHGA